MASEIDATTFSCLICGKEFKKTINLKKHYLIHTKSRPFQCNVCKKTFRERKHLTSHSLLHTGEKPFGCPHCDKAFNQKSNLKRHIKIHLDDRPFACSICSNRFTQQCYLKEHMKTHTGERAYECAKCGKTFKNTSHLTSHMRCHSNVRPYNCTLCDKTFKYLSNYSLHLTSHDGDASQSCPKCGKVFLNKNNLRLHMLSHTKLKDIECFVCGKEFKKLYKFRSHLQVHTGERPFKCHLCEEGFKSKTNLKYHLMLHSGEMPFTCEVCGKGLRSKSYLASHMVSHQRSRHTCRICSKSFKYKSNFKQHMNTHRNQDTNEEHHLSPVLPEEPSSSRKVVIQIPNSSLRPWERDILASEGNSDKAVETQPLNTDRKIEKSSHEVRVISSMSADFQNFVVDADCETNEIRNHNPPITCSLDSVKIQVKAFSVDHPFRCRHCKETFRQEGHLKEHLDFHSTDPYQSHHCKAYCKSDDSLEQRLPGKDGICSAKSEKSQKSLVCHPETKQLCQISSDKSVLEKQASKHTGKKCNCLTCNKKFENSNLQTHMISDVADTFTEEVEKPFSCNVCDLKFLYLHNLKIHEMIHVMKNDSLQINNGTINESSALDDKVIVQTLMAHCYQENALFLSDSSEVVSSIELDVDVDGAQKDHVTMSIDTNGRWEVEDRKTKRISGNVGAQDGSTIQAKIFRCVICSKDFVEEAMLKAHIRQHTPECPQCGKSFNRLNNLKRHMAVHENSRSLDCSLCDMRFKENNQLKTHFMFAHCEDYGFECEYCDKKFEYKSHYLMHRSVHTANWRSESADNRVRLQQASQMISDTKTATPIGSDGGGDSNKISSACPLQIRVFTEQTNLDEGHRFDCCLYGKGDKKLPDRPKKDHSNILPHNTTANEVIKKQERKKVCEEERKKVCEESRIRSDAGKNCDRNISDKIRANIRRSLWIPRGDVELTNEILCGVSEPSMEIQVGKLSVQTISYEAAVKRSQLLKNKKLHKCPKCSKLFSRKTYLVRHIEKHKPSTRLKCSHCDNVFKNISQWEAHMESLISCENGSSECASQKQLNAIHNMEESSGSILLDGVVGHSVRVNAKDDPLACSICGLKFNFQHHLDDHQKLHSLHKVISHEKNCEYKIVIKSRETKRVNSLKMEDQVGAKSRRICKVKKTSTPSQSQIEGEMELGKLTIKTLSIV